MLDDLIEQMEKSEEYKYFTFHIRLERETAFYGWMVLIILISTLKSLNI